MSRLAQLASLSLVLLLVVCTVPACGDDDDGPAPGVDSGLLPVDGAVADAAEPIDDAAIHDADTTDADTTDAGPIADGAPGIDGAVGVTCGNTTCGASDECCATVINKQPIFMCVNAGTCEGTPIVCDGPEDCGGHACCAGVFGGSGSLACSDTSTCGAQELTLCHDDSNCQPPMGGTVGPTCCPPNAQFGNFAYCLPVGDTCF